VFQIPKHIAIIMDGNGRWANSHSHTRVWGHIKGATKIKPLVKHCEKIGVEALTLYAFSSENWMRPKTEVSTLMKLLKKYLKLETSEMLRDNVRFKVFGDKSRWPPDVKKEVFKTEEILKNNTGFQLNFAFSYGSKAEIAYATKEIAKRVSSGEISLDDIDEGTIERFLWTRGLPPLDLLIRTGGEVRISNFLLWQAAYSEFVFSEVPWPEFSPKNIDEAIDIFQNRQRRFGKTSGQITEMTQ